ncbi:24894_t:CDS:1, partial [Racocetra persica]
MVLVVLLDKTKNKNETYLKKKPHMKVETLKPSIKLAKDKLTQKNFS